MVNAFDMHDLVVIEPKEEKEISGWFQYLNLPEPRTYKIKAYYQNDPTMEVEGHPLDPNNKEALEKLKASHACELSSNELTIEVKE